MADKTTNNDASESDASRSILGQIGRVLGSLLDLHGLDLDGDQMSAPPGAPPGIDAVHGANTPAAPGDVQVSWMEYSHDTYSDGSANTIEALPPDERAPEGGARWINIDGLNPFVIREMQRRYGFHTLAAEDALHATQRPRVDRYTDHLVVFVRMLRLVDDALISEQVSLFLCGDTLITFQETPGDIWEPVRARIRTEGTRVRRAGADFLLYALLDALVDHCVPVLERYGDLLDNLETRVFRHTAQSQLRDIYTVRRELTSLRRLIRPLREIADRLIHADSEVIREETRTFLRDVYEHASRLAETVELQRELTSSSIDLFMSLASHRMNEVMKVLTIISTIFIPLSFIAGVYGMNFDPGSSPLNMPETRWYYGYPVALAMMVMVSGVMVVFFVRRGWIGR